MAHIEKYKRTQVAPMIRHYERTMDATLQRANIDALRTDLNYEVTGTDGHIDVEDTIARLVELHNAHGRAIRSDAVVMADLVITMPKGFPEDRADEFFVKAAEFADGFWSPAVCPQGYVHMDESQPHMHLPIIPFDQEAQRFRARDIITRTKLRQMHGQMEQYLRRELGMERVGVELTKQERGQRELEYTGLKAYQEARDELARAKQESAREQSRADHERNRADAYAAQARTAEQELAKAKELAATNEGQARAWAEQARTNQTAAEGWEQTRAANEAAANQEQQRLELLRRSCGEQEAEIGRLDEQIRAAEQQQREQREQALQQSVGGGPAEQAPEQPEQGLRGLVHLAQREMGGAGSLAEQERQEAARAKQLDGQLKAARDQFERAKAVNRGLRERYEDAAANLERLEQRTRDVERAVGELRERVRDALERLVERLRDMTRTMGLEAASERLGQVFERLDMPVHPPGMHEAVERGLDGWYADRMAPRDYEYGYEQEPEYEQEIEAPTRGIDLGWDR